MDLWGGRGPVKEAGREAGKDLFEGHGMTIALSEGILQIVD